MKTININDLREIVDTSSSNLKKASHFLEIESLIKQLREIEKCYLKGTFYKRVRLSNHTVSIGTIQYDLSIRDKTRESIYSKGYYSIYVYVERDINIRGNMLTHNDIVSSISDRIGVMPHVEDTIKTLKKYGCNNPYDVLWISSKGKWFAGNKQVKPGKLLRSLYPNMGTDIMNSIIDEVKTSTIEISKMTEIMRVEDAYRSTKLKIGSCMTHDHVNHDLYDALGVKCIVVKDENGNYIARSLLWPTERGAYVHDRVYSTTAIMTSKFKRYLSSTYPTTKKIKVDGYKSTVVKGKPSDWFMPYMDTMCYVKVVEGGFYLTNKRESSEFKCNNTQGIANEI